MRVEGTHVLVSVLTLAVVLLAVLACGDDTTSSGVTPATGDGEDSSVSSSTSAPGRSTMTLDEYVSQCALYADDEIPEDATSGEASEELARSIELMEAINPPPEVADYHNETLSYGKALKSLLDAQPEDEQPNLLSLLVLVPQGLAVEDAMNNLDPEVRRQLAAVGCASEGEAPELDSPGNVRVAVEGSTIRVSWDGVDRAGYYNVYHGNQPNCRVVARRRHLGL